MSTQPARRVQLRSSRSRVYGSRRRRRGYRSDRRRGYGLPRGRTDRGDAAATTQNRVSIGFDRPRALFRAERRTVVCGVTMHVTSRKSPQRRVGGDKREDKACCQASEHAHRKRERLSLRPARDRVCVSPDPIATGVQGTGAVAAVEWPELLDSRDSRARPAQWRESSERQRERLPARRRRDATRRVVET